ncbi:uncharacterized protein [Ptychodera flava]|uniref:uncharacterized protein isoform X2 n=1 Tax=Ptychodera flava TaxID=63121 RepID=UPI00396A8F14
MISPIKCNVVLNTVVLVLSWTIPVMNLQDNSVHAADADRKPPNFYGLPYEGDVPINARVGDHVLTVVAQNDGELGTCNASISYSLHADDDTLALAHFTIDPYKGDVLVARRFDDAEQGQWQTDIYEFFVRATDDGCWSKYSEAPVKVFVWVQPIFDIPGQMYNMSTSPVEGDEPMSWCEKIPEAFYNGPINGSIKYSITAGDDNDHFTIDEDTGEICNKVELDREDIAEYNLLISTFIKNGSDGISANKESSAASLDHCQDLLLSELCVLIRVEDINDNSPRFQKDIYAIGIYHDIPPGTKIIKVTADDDDIGNNSALLYEVEDNLSQFAVQQWSGMIYLTEQLNADESSTYEFFVKATDNFGYGLSSANARVKIMTTRIKNAIIMTSSSSEMYIKLNSQEIISDLQDHLRLDVAILIIGPSVSENQVIDIDLTDVWFTCTYPQTHTVVEGEHIIENPLPAEFESKWRITSTVLGHTGRWPVSAPVDCASTAGLIAALVTVFVLLVLAIIYIVLRERQMINPPFLKYLSRSYDPTQRENGYEIEVLTQPATQEQPRNFDPAHELKRSDITVLHKLGEGNFGTVEKAKLANLAGQRGAIDVAVKSLNRGVETEKAKTEFEKELKVISSLDYHPNIIACIGFVTVGDPTLFVFEFAPEGDLLNYLKRKKVDGISQEKLVNFTLDVAKGMEFLSSKAIIHRDLAARNVLVGDKDTCKIADFGLSRLGEIYVKLSEDKIPIYWTAPECLGDTEPTYNTKTDVWSFGVVMWEIMSLGDRPYSAGLSRRIKSFLEGGGRLKKPNECSDRVYLVMKKCWDLDQNNRPHFITLVAEIEDILADVTSPKFPPPQELKRSDIKPICELGEGKFGTVQKATLENLGGQLDTIEVAVKSLKLDSESYEAVFAKELKAITSLEHHPNVIALIGYVTDDDPMLLVFEFAQNGDLLKYLRKNKGVGIKQDKLMNFILDVAKGMEYLSSKSIIHRDLAARNVLVGETEICKIADFGLSRIGETYVKLSEDQIPIYWTAPECLDQQEPTYNTKTDVWSFGIVMWEIMSFGKKPYAAGMKSRIKQYLESGNRLKQPDDCPDQVFDVMKKCWELDQNDRPSFRRLVVDVDSIQRHLKDNRNSAVDEYPSEIYDDVDIGAQLEETNDYDDISIG